MRYYIKRGTKKVFAEALADIKEIAQEEADRLGRAVMIYGDSVNDAVKKVYKRNPVKKGKYSVSYYVPEERYWQFAGEWDNKRDADKRAKYLKDRDHKVRVRKIA